MNRHCTVQCTVCEFTIGTENKLFKLFLLVSFGVAQQFLWTRLVLRNIFNSEIRSKANEPRKKTLIASRLPCQKHTHVHMNRIAIGLRCTNLSFLTYPPPPHLYTSTAFIPPIPFITHITTSNPPPV